MIVDHGHDLVAEPDVRILLDLQRVAEEVEVVAGVSIALDQVLELVLHVIDAESGVQPRGLHGVEGSDPATGHFAHEQEFLLAEALRELVDGRGEVTRGPVAHVLHGVDAISVEIREGDPELVHLAESPEPRSGRKSVRLP